MSDQYRVTEKGMLLALRLLQREGFLLEEPGVNVTADLIAAKRACGKYIEASKAKGDARSDQDCQDAVMIAYFEAWLEDITRKIN
jgi:hypothetical protein